MLSINITVHNKEYLIDKVLNGVIKNTTGKNYEIIVVLDGCTDNSEQTVSLIRDWHKGEKKIKILYADDVFETKANNIAARASEGDYICIIQDDQVITEKGWNERMLKPFTAFDDVFAVTANCAHNWRFNQYSKDFYTDKVYNDRWCDMLEHIDHANKTNIDRNTFAVRSCVNRSPLVIKHSDFEKLNYFDEIYSPLQFDDHDLCMRAKKELGKVVGCYWIDYTSKPEWGGTRDSQGKTKPFMYEADHKNSHIFYNRHKEAIKEKVIENRYHKE